MQSHHIARRARDIAVPARCTRHARARRRLGRRHPGHSARDRATRLARRAARREWKEGDVPHAGGDRARARQCSRGRVARRGLRAGRAFDVVISRAFSDLRTLRRSAPRNTSRAGGILVAMKGVLPQDEIDALPDAHRSHRDAGARRAGPRRGAPSRRDARARRARDDAHHRGREPEGRRRQDDDDGQSRGEPRRDEAPRARRRPRSAGQRDDGRGRRQARVQAHRLPRAARRGEHRRRARSLRHRRIRSRARESRARRRRSRARRSAGARNAAEGRARRSLAADARRDRRDCRRLRLHLPRLPAVAVAADAERPVRRRLGADSRCNASTTRSKGFPISCRR